MTISGGPSTSEESAACSGQSPSSAIGANLTREHARPRAQQLQKVGNSRANPNVHTLLWRCARGQAHSSPALDS